MTEYEKIIGKIASAARIEAGVPVYHAPSPSAGEKVIYRCTPGKYDGDHECFKVTMRFISRDLSQAFERATAVSRYLCSPGGRSITEDGCPVFTVREEGGSSGFIGRTGHYFVLTVFEVKRRMPSSVEIGYAVHEGV